MTAPPLPPGMMPAGTPATYVEATEVYLGSNGDRTRALYKRVEALGPAGELAVNLFRAHKASSRAKVYRGGGYKDAAYDTKQWSLNNAVELLLKRDLGIGFGWKEDPERPYHRWVIYIELPTGQVSFHTAARGLGPDYPREWDGVREQGATRICHFLAEILAGPA
mgnify:CR=1 FL=1